MPRRTSQDAKNPRNTARKAPELAKKTEGIALSQHVRAGISPTSRSVGTPKVWLDSEESLRLVCWNAAALA